MADITRGTTYSVTETITNAKLHALVDDATIANIVNTDIDANAGIVASKLSDITDAGKVSGSAIRNLPSLPSSAGLIPYINIPSQSLASIPNSSLIPLSLASWVSGQAFKDLASIPSSAGLFPPANLPSGSVRKIVNYQTGAVSTGTTILPMDDTIPQNTEGDQVMSLAIAPTSASNYLRIEVIAILSHNSATGLGIALFQDSTADALASAVVYTTAGNLAVITLSYWMVSGTTSSTTFKVRAGSAGSGTTTFNGVGGGRLFGGVASSSITITEYGA